jgi:ubiquinone/menaquinone biosynthesis C-methylase UbiE
MIFPEEPAGKFCSTLFHDFYDLLSEESAAKFFKTVENITAEFENFNSPKKVLEVGTAEAYNIRELVRRRAINFAVGYDISKRNLKTARKKIKQQGLENRVKLSLGDGKNLKFPDNKFDITILTQVLEHIPTREGVRDLLLESRRVSSQGLIVSLPLRDASEFLVRIAKYLDFDHVRKLIQYRNHWIYEPDKVEKLFQEIGFKFERSKNTDYFYVLK